MGRRQPEGLCAHRTYPGRVGVPALVTLPSAIQRPAHTNAQNSYLSRTPVWRPETDTNLLLISHKGVFIIVTDAELKILAALTALTELSLFYFASS